MPESGLGLALVWPLIESLDALRYCDRDDVFGLLREAIEERWPEIEMSQRRQPEPLEDPIPKIFVLLVIINLS